MSEAQSSLATSGNGTRANEDEEVTFVDEAGFLVRGSKRARAAEPPSSTTTTTTTTSSSSSSASAATRPSSSVTHKDNDTGALDVRQVAAAERALVLDADQRRALDAYARGANVFITGSAGCGKSALLRVLLKRADAAGTRYAATASTNLAALAVGGTTLHAFAGLRLDSEPLADVYTRLGKGYMSRHRRLVRETRVLFIDEISMTSDVLLERASDVVNWVCAKRHVVAPDARPFGGKQLVVVGDFMQLPPVRRGGERFAFQSTRVWAAAAFEVVQLRQPHRQSADVRFFAMLQRLRFGEHTPDDVAMLRSRLVAPGTDVRAVTLCPLRANVDDINRARLAQLDAASEHMYVAETRVLPLAEIEPEVETMASWLGVGASSSSSSIADAKDASAAAVRARLAAIDTSRATRDILSPPTLALRVGARVLLTRPLGADLVNGSAGVVVGFASDAHTGAHEALPLVDFDGVREAYVAPATWTIENKAEGYVVEYTQVPLMLAWGITTHKSQGMTITRLAVDLGDSNFEDNQAYTAVSRTDALDHLLVLKLSERALRASAEARAYYRALDAAS